MTVLLRASILAGAILFSISIGVRLAAVWLISPDVRWLIMPWYSKLVELGFRALATDFSNYMPPYLYLPWLAASARDPIPKVPAIKLIPILFDISNSLWVDKMNTLLVAALLWMQYHLTKPPEPGTK